MVDRNKQIVERLIKEAWTGRNVALVDELVSPDYVEYAPFGVLRGLKDYKDGIHMFNSAFPGLNIKIDQVIAEGDTVAVRITATGTHRGEFMGIPGTGRKIQFTALDFTRIKNGKVVEEWLSMDMAGLMSQIQGSKA